MENTRCVQLGLFENCVRAHITLRPPHIQHMREVVRTMQCELGESFCDELDVTYSEADNTCTILLTVNPYTESDVVNRMLVLQWMVKRLATFSPPLDLSNLCAMQTAVLH